MQFQEEKLPVLLFLWEHKKFIQIIKAMLNETVSNNLLTECGYAKQELSTLEQYKMNAALPRYNIQQLILLKGSSFQNAKEYQNKPLQQTIKKKLLTEKPTQQTRKILWVQFTEIFQKKYLYKELKRFELASQFQTIIQKDINRTYKIPQVKFKTEEVLSVFARYNPYIGYCQGMNSIIAFLIDDGFGCEQAFFIFKRISEILLPSDYYSSMDTIMAYMRIFYEMLSLTHPQCYSKMKKICKQMDLNYMAMVSFVLQWFVCLFSNQNVHIEITRVIWDFFLVEGITVLFKASLAMFDLLQPYILDCHSFQQYNQMQKKRFKQIKDSNYIRNKIMSTYISPQILHLLRQKLTEQDQRHNKNQQKIKKKEQPSKKRCNRKWNACLQVLENNLNIHYSFDHFVIKQKGEINIEHNYMEKLDKMYFNNAEKSKDPLDDIMIGRIPHICQPQQQSITEDSSSEKTPGSEKKQKKAFIKLITDSKSPVKFNKQQLRKKAVVRVEQEMTKKVGMERSQSMIFMREMAQNVSLSNLLELYEIDQMFQ